MFEPPQLTNRHEQVLSATVRHYVATAEPVSSKRLLQEHDFAVSSATIRNAMGWLEKAGLLLQPHTSAGRVPSDRGYRLYVDRLMVPDVRLGRQAGRRLASEPEACQGSLEARLQGAARILATVSGYIALVTPPQSRA
ncbi:MAG: heat-inducible transcriptional repressor HrcA, partial [Cyanobacteria bacterium J06641_5]